MVATRSEHPKYSRESRHLPVTQSTLDLAWTISRYYQEGHALGFVPQAWLRLSCRIPKYKLSRFELGQLLYPSSWKSQHATLSYQSRHDRQGSRGWCLYCGAVTHRYRKGPFADNWFQIPCTSDARFPGWWTTGLVDCLWGGYLTSPHRWFSDLNLPPVGYV